MIHKLLNRTELQALLVGLLLIILNKKLGLNLTEAQAWQIVGLISAYATSRGVAKLGEGKAAAEDAAPLPEADEDEADEDEADEDE